MHAPTLETRERVTLAELDAQLADCLPARELMGAPGGYGKSCCGPLISIRLCLAIGLL